MSRKILGLDIRKDAISAVLLQSKIKGMSIEAHAFIPVSAPDGIRQGVSDCIGSLMKQADLSGATCIAAYPSEKIFYRNIRVPFKAQKKIGQILPYELEPTLPLPIEDLIIDFYIPRLNSPSDYTDLVAAGVEISELEAFLEILAEFNLTPSVLTAGGYATALTVAGTESIPGVCFFIDVGTQTCGLFVIISGRICYLRSFSLQSEASSKAAVICSHIRQTASAVAEIFQMEIKAGGVFITGCGAEDKTVLNEIAQKLEIPVTAIDLTKRTDVTVKNPAITAWKPHRLDNAFALALHEIEGLPFLNFRKGPFAPKKLWVEHKKYLLRTAMLAGLIASFAFFDIVMDNYFMEKKVAGLNTQITNIFKTALPDIQKIVDPLQQMRVELKKLQQQPLLPDSSPKNFRNIDILHDISMLIPDEVNVELNRIVIGPGSVTISGYTDTFNSVNTIQRRLQDGKLFKTVTINSANIEKAENRVSFKLNLQL